MRHVREILRLKLGSGLPTRDIARRVGVAPSTVRLTLERFAASGLTWPLPETLTDDAVLEESLLTRGGGKQGHRRHAEPDWAVVHRELKRKHVTLSILWEEYIAQNPTGYRYSRFCELYRGWAGKLSVTMRQTHVGGEKLFVDYASDTVPVIIDRLTARTIEVFLKGERIAVHVRSSGNGKHTTVPEHMPSSHRRFADWTLERIRREAAAIGPSTALLCEAILEHRPHPEQGFRACLGIVRLLKPFGAERVEAAATRALEIGARTYGSVKSILDNHLDRQPVGGGLGRGLAIQHPNIRGGRYYH